MTQVNECSKHTQEVLVFERAQNEEDSYRFELYLYFYGSRRDIGTIEHKDCLVLLYFFEIKFFQDLELRTSMDSMSLYHKDRYAKGQVILIMGSKSILVIA